MINKEVLTQFIYKFLMELSKALDTLNQELLILKRSAYDFNNSPIKIILHLE